MVAVLGPYEALPYYLHTYIQSKIESSHKELQGLQKHMENNLKSEIEKINLRVEKENQQIKDFLTR
jgi:hypothetical protein